MYTNCFRFLNKESIEDVHAMTWHEYELLMKAYRLKKVDDNRTIHWQAFVNQQVKAAKGSGKHVKPAYKTFNDFFNYEKEIQNILHPEEEEAPKYSTKVIDMMTREYTF